MEYIDNKFTFNRGDTERVEALQILLRHGVLEMASDTPLYHGRAGDGSGFAVDPFYRNDGNATGNHNVNGRPTLYTTKDLSVAEAFARERVNSRSKTPEVHTIGSFQRDAMILNTLALSKLSTGAVMECRAAMRKLIHSLGVSHFCDVRFEDRDNYNSVRNCLVDFIKTQSDLVSPIARGASLVDKDTINNFIKYARANKYHPNLINDVVKLMAGINGFYSLENCYLKELSKIYLSGIHPKDKVFTDTPLKGVHYGDRTYDIPISGSVFATFLRDNHIIGVKNNIDSATLGKTIEVVSLFDLYKVNTDSKVGDRLSALHNYYAPINNALGSFATDEVRKRLSYTPNLLMKYITSTYPKMEKIYSAHSGVWEGFTVGQHTETVLRLYDEGYNVSNDLNPNVRSFMNMAILCHDLGKSQTSRDKKEIDKSTREIAMQLCKSMGLSKKDYELICAVALDSQKYTTQYYVDSFYDASALTNLRSLCRDALEKYLGYEPNEQMIKGLEGMCRELQTCDSAAYSRYGKTRDTRRKVEHFNGSDLFTRGFMNYAGQVRFMSDLTDTIYGVEANTGRDK